jgi:PGF-pre-PGF domain-containing protein
MNQTTVRGNFSISPSVSGIYSWSNSNKTLTFNPSSNLGYSTSYTVTIDWNATDTYGNVMIDNHSWNFTTESKSEGGDGGGGEATNRAPSAEAGGPYSGYVNATITFDGSKSNDSDGTISGYKWDFENDGTYDTGWLTTATITHSYSSAGTYIVKLQVKDNANATATDTATVIISVVPYGDKPPLISNIQHTPKEVTNSDNVTISANVTDDYGITSVNLYWNDGSDHTKPMSNAVGDTYSATIGPFSAGTIKYSVDATDTAGKTTQSSSYTFTVAAVVVLGNISSGETSNITSDELEGTGLEKISFTTTTDLHDVKTKIEKLPGLPEKIPDLISLEYQGDGVLYQYYNVTITSNGTEINESDIESGIITIEVSKNWFRENNVSNNSIVMFRYHNSTWNNLTTTHLEIENETFEFYEVLTPGFSTFAVVGSKIIETELVEKHEEIPWVMIIGFIIASIVILIIILFKARYIYIEKEEPEEKHKENYPQKTESEDESRIYDLIIENEEETQEKK